MALRAILVCLSLYFILNHSGSITSAEVNLFPLNDVSICGGMKAHFSCTTTSTSRYFLLWSIDSVPVNDVFDNMTVVGSPFLKNGSVFTLTNRSIHSGIYTLTATAEINATQRTEVACSDGSFNPSHTVYLRVNHIVNEVIGSVSENNITTSWRNPNGSGVCCERYHVVTSEGYDDVIETTSYTFQDVTTTEQREKAAISVRCQDKLGIDGPAVFFTPNITRPLVVVFPPAIVGDFCGNGNITYDIRLVFQESSGALVAEIQDCFIDGHNCSLESGMASINTVGLVPFNATINFTYYLGHDPTEHQVTMNANQLRILQDACDCQEQELTPTTATVAQCPTTATVAQFPTTTAVAQCPTTATVSQCPTTATVSQCPTTATVVLGTLFCLALVTIIVAAIIIVVMVILYLKNKGLCCVTKELDKSAIEVNITKTSKC